ncbi:MAG: DUF6011 domain-containing protein, partial [Kitasatospora sp.]|nr:DUF6011 domain-containing protein [Kitasatospora sp.]
MVRCRRCHRPLRSPESR